MRSWCLPSLALLAAVVPVVGSAPLASADDPKPAEKAPPGDGVFGFDKVWQFGVELSAEEYAAMQPTGGGFPGFPGGPPQPPAALKPGEGDRETHRNTFGMSFPVARGAFTAEGTTFKNVSVRYKGNFNYVAASRSLKRPLKIELTHFDEKNPLFHGLRNITLNASALDPTKCRESLAYAVFRAAGVPAPRTAFAEVTLTVPGKYDKEYLGLYTLVEDVDRTFLKTHFKSAKGLLCKPEGVRGIEYLGEDWNAYKSRYQAKHDPAEKDGRRLIDFARLVNRATDDEFRKQIGSFLDIDEFLRFVVVNALVANLDSFFTLGHNYYLYLNPHTNKFVFIPWDLDLSLAAWPAVGTPELQMDLSLMHPHAGENKLIDRLLAIKEVNVQYRTLLAELAAGCFAKDRLLKDVEAVERTTKDLVAKDAKAAAARKEGGGFGPPGGFGRPAPDLRTFIEKRTESVAAQLAGRRTGYVPVFGFGGPPGGMRPPRPGEVMPPPLQDALRLTDEQRRKFAELQKEIDARVEELLTEEQRKQLKRIREGNPGGPPGPGKP